MTNVTTFTNGSLILDTNSNVDASASLALVLQAVGMTVLALYSKMLYQKTPLKHPIYALLFQESMVLLCFQLLGMVYLVKGWAVASLSLKDIFKYVNFTFLVTNTLHQITWLSLTFLRFYFLVWLKKHGGNPNLSKIALIGVIFVLCGSGIYLVSSQLLFLFLSRLTLSSTDEPNYDQMYTAPNLERLAVRFAVAVVMNLPDAASIAIYAFMRRELRSLSAIAPAPTLDQDDDDAIFAGPTHSPPPPPPPTPDPNPLAMPDPSESAEELAISLSLKSHVCSCLLDVCLPLALLIPWHLRVFLHLPLLTILGVLYPVVMGIANHSVLKKEALDKLKKMKKVFGKST